MKTISYDKNKVKWSSIYAGYDLFQGVEIRFDPSQCDEQPDLELEGLAACLKLDKDFQSDGYSYNWFDAKIEVNHKRTGFVAFAYLGSCSYESYDAFLNDPYCTDMINQCVDEINEKIAAINAKTKLNWSTRRELINHDLYKYFLYNLQSFKQY